MIAISDRTRSLLYVTSAAMLVAWSAGTASIERSIASEPAVSSDIEAAARGKVAFDIADPDPTLPPIARDPFAARARVVPTPAPAPSVVASAARGRHGRVGKGGLHVPDIDGSGDGDAAESTVYLRGIIAGGATAGAVAIVDSGHGTQFVHAGDALGGRTIKLISADGIVFSDGSRLGLAASGSK